MEKGLTNNNFYDIITIEREVKKMIKTVFETSDGMQFEEHYDAIKHERKLIAKNVEGPYLILYDHYADLYVNGKLITEDYNLDFNSYANNDNLRRFVFDLFKFGGLKIFSEEGKLLTEEDIADETSF